jgi:hypothetical protein
MIKRTLPILLAVTVMLTACGPQGTPTMSPVEVQGTAVAAAWTMVAATQQANPTATPLPPTETPSPTPPPTFTPLATLGLLNPPTPTYAVVAAGTDTCLHPINMGEAGKKQRIRIENESGGTINLSINLWKPNAFGQCGALSYANVQKYGKFIIQLPVGSYYAYAWITLKGGKKMTSGGSFVVPQGGDDLFRLIIRPESIKFTV